MSEYLERCFKSYPTKAAAIAGAIKQIEAARRGEPQGMRASIKQQFATKVRNDNAWIALYSPPLPAHIKKERNDKETQRLAILINQAHGKSGASYDYGVGQYNSD